MKHLKKTIEKQGGTIEVIIPGFAFELYKNVKIGQSFTPETAKAVLRSIDSIKDQSLLVNQEPVLSDDDIKKEPESVSPMKDPKKRIAALGGTFGVLILVLIGVSLWQFVFVGKKTPPPPPTPDKNVGIAQIPTATPTIPVATSSSALEKQSVTIQIVSNPQIRSSAIQLQKQFEENGFSNVRIGTTNTNPQTTQIVYKSTVSSPIKQELTTIVNSLYSNASVVENNEAQFDANITISAPVSASQSAAATPTAIPQ